MLLLRIHNQCTSQIRLRQEQVWSSKSSRRAFSHYWENIMHHQMEKYKSNPPLTWMPDLYLYLWSTHLSHLTGSLSEISPPWLPPPGLIHWLRHDALAFMEQRLSCRALSLLRENKRGGFVTGCPPLFCLCREWSGVTNSHMTNMRTKVQYDQAFVPADSNKRLTRWTYLTD